MIQYCISLNLEMYDKCYVSITQITHVNKKTIPGLTESISCVEDEALYMMANQNESEFVIYCYLIHTMSPINNEA